MIITTISRLLGERAAVLIQAIKMLIGRASLIFAFFFLASIAQAQSASRTMGSADGLVNAGIEALRDGDTVDVQVFNTPELSGKLRVDPRGRIDFPIGISVDVNGLTADQAARAIEKVLRDQQIMYTPQVSVFVSQFATQGVTVMGEVKTPGIYPIRGSHSLSDVLAEAGGPTAISGGAVTVTRRTDIENPIVVDMSNVNYAELSENTLINPGDTVKVSKADMVYVIGEVRAPAAYPMTNGQHLKVLNILSLCGGTTLTAKGSKASIIRVKGAGVETIPLDLDKIVKNEAENLTLQPSDVLVVPRSGAKAFVQLTLPAVANSAISAGASALIIK